ncbi:acyltransferase [Pedobacter xixiisoli]|uniref:UDP-2-acetamido-3-amino-2,3-dideoxy-glucuronate N-acetyltransferase n=1 Tax=Pedobacter xixiisoli TaxID=1476464 RepID=A0A286AEK5_9SPHI|nr:acyltransferase [Pedobacter xixiisoli]SOD20332.1 UDP-2-acetamido-3-amino-2,3-dideoxy-glucuronate N-acetyltransferase [Pedobacter xixiisoli]
MPIRYFAHETAVVDEGAIIGTGTKIWHFSHIMTNANIGEYCIIGQNVMVASKVVVGNGVKIQNNVSVFEGVLIADDVFIGPSVTFTNVKIPRSFVNRKSQFLQTNVGKGASIGANATIVCGSNIGDFAMIGAGAVVTKDVAPYSLVIGNPAKHVGWVSQYGQLLDFTSNEVAECTESAQKYILLNNQICKLD